MQNQEADGDPALLPAELSRDDAQPVAPAGAATELVDRDEALDEQAQGQGLTSDDGPDGLSEVDAMADAAGLGPDGDTPFVGITGVERRDAARWELDPRSAEDVDERAHDLLER